MIIFIYENMIIYIVNECRKDRELFRLSQIVHSFEKPSTRHIATNLYDPVIFVHLK